MKISYLPKFKKQFAKLTPKIQNQFAERLELFIRDPSELRLRNHPLKGNFAGYWSININGDVRALYYFEYDGAMVVFALIGTHSQIY